MPCLDNKPITSHSVMDFTMFKLSICLLTFNSARLLREVLPPLTRIADEFVVIDSGSTDATLSICAEFGITPIYHPFATHGQQMNFAISQASNEWVLCMDSDEIMGNDMVAAILELKQQNAPETSKAFRITRHWYVLNKPVRTIYPVSSPDYPIRLFNRNNVQFNDAPVDDAAEGSVTTEILAGKVRHDTFYSLHEVFGKLNVYTSRLVAHRKIRPSISRGIISAFGAFWKWYVFSGAWKEGKVGAVTGLYATLYSFLKYFKAWYKD